MFSHETDARACNYSNVHAFVYTCTMNNEYIFVEVKRAGSSATASGNQVHHLVQCKLFTSDYVIQNCML